MRSLQRRRWVDTTLDYYRAPDDYRVRVTALANIEQLTDLYFVRPRSARLIWNYLSQVGPVGVWRKVASRLQERFRNEKYVSFGYGEVLEAPERGRFGLGERVVFFAPGFPACAERVVLPEHLIAGQEDVVEHPGEGNELLHLELSNELAPKESWWQLVRGYDRNSGRIIPELAARGITEGLGQLAQKIDWTNAECRSIDPPSPIAEVHARPTPVAPAGLKKAVLFGYGHYAKTNILPNVRSSIWVDTVHEVDPAQIPSDRGGIPLWDTAPSPRRGETYDVYLIASYHHTHAPLAIEALRRGAYAVVEKPIAVDHAQLDALIDAVQSADRGYFGCFHKRYSALNDFALNDLRQPPGGAIDYHCIVYEVPLPDLHWYRWPNSKSRLVSNGCHWIDHFLYMNGFSEVASYRLERSPSDVVNCSITLENGAYFTMVLTDKGGERIGLQDYVEMRSGDVTVKIVNNASYVAEDCDRVIRRRRINKILPYKQMYRTIAHRIANDEGGDTVQSIQVSTKLVLDLEDELKRLSAEFWPLEERE
ncbi:MAG: Gfo/Idh/MocA family oxidoreductase [Deltaproteobacteria bacterium]|nr:Gfo/Idh/MocA family oxidoreductase [Deltaproteobacteria bacterium]MBW2696641.1 Gfo/Idh/MocA family oxidoreductase [Deltaproteobacteria bacterium]